MRPRRDWDRERLALGGVGLLSRARGTAPRATWHRGWSGRFGETATCRIVGAMVASGRAAGFVKKGCSDGLAFHEAARRRWWRPCHGGVYPWT